jgi:hypothetical protein
MAGDPRLQHAQAFACKPRLGDWPGIEGANLAVEMNGTTDQSSRF